MQHTEATIVARDKICLYTQAWYPEAEIKAVVCLVHGLGEHSGRYTHVAATLTEAGYVLAGYDLRGHGQSEGARGNIPSYDTLMEDIALHLTAARARYPGKPAFLYGQSLGGNLVLNFAMRRKPDLAGVIATDPWLRLAFAPPALKVALGKIMNTVYPAYTQASGLETPALSRDRQVVERYESDPLVHDRISARLFDGCYESGFWALEHAADFVLPLLLMHGSADRITSAEASRQFAQAAGACCTLKIWEGLYHEIHNEPEQAAVLSFIVDWLDQHTPR